jgi:ADP-ribose pyrophosphatase YjhB (NUDIX family)
MHELEKQEPCLNRPHITVAAVIEDNSRFLMVEETSSGRLVLNQPAGHLENGESVIDAVIRETFEETAWSFVPESLVGIYLWHQPKISASSYLRISFCGRIRDHDPLSSLDEGIERTLWLTREQLIREKARLRSPMVLESIEDYVSGRRFSLNLLKSFLK